MAKMIAMRMPTVTTLLVLLPAPATLGIVEMGNHAMVLDF